MKAKALPFFLSLRKKSNNNIIRGLREALFFDLSLCLFIQGGKLSRCRGHRFLQGGIRTWRRYKHHSVSRAERQAEQPLRNKHHSLERKWGVILRTGVFMFVCISVNSVRDILNVCQRGRVYFFCLLRP